MPPGSLPYPIDIWNLIPKTSPSAVWVGCWRAGHWQARWLLLNSSWRVVGDIARPPNSDAVRTPVLPSFSPRQQTELSGQIAENRSWPLPSVTRQDLWRRFWDPIPISIRLFAAGPPTVIASARSWSHQRYPIEAPDSLPRCRKNFPTVARTRASITSPITPIPGLCFLGLQRHYLIENRASVTMVAAKQQCLSQLAGSAARRSFPFSFSTCPPRAGPEECRSPRSSLSSWGGGGRLGKIQVNVRSSVLSPISRNGSCSSHPRALWVSSLVVRCTGPLPAVATATCDCQSFRNLERAALTALSSRCLPCQEHITETVLRQSLTC